MLRELSFVHVDCVEVVDAGIHALSQTRIRALRDSISSYSCSISVHAPWFGLDLSSPVKPALNAMMKSLEVSIRNAGELGAEVWVVHGGSRNDYSLFYPGQDQKTNIESLSHLMRVADDIGVKMAVENLWKQDILYDVDDLLKFSEETGGRARFTLDTGHANLTGHLNTFIPALGNSLIHVHASDNNGDFDAHLGVGRGTIDWKKVASQLKQANYKGMVIAEVKENVEESVKTLHELLF
jgi:sugar phosphate isomerase/epimerase